LLSLRSSLRSSLGLTSRNHESSHSYFAHLCRLSMHFDKELFNLKQNYESERQKNVSVLIKEEIEKREEVVAEKDEEIRGLEEELRSLSESLQKRSEDDLKEHEALHVKLEEEKAR